jgi:hypothetical protein
MVTRSYSITRVPVWPSIRVDDKMKSEGANMKYSANTDSTIEERHNASSVTAERRKYLGRVQARLAGGDPLKRRIEVAIGILRRLESSVGQATADEVGEAEAVFLQVIESEKEAGGRELERVTRECRDARMLRMEQLMSGSSATQAEWSVLQDAFKAAHRQNPDLSAWIPINESPLPAGSGSLHFRELANRAAWTWARVTGDDAWKSWLDVVVGYLLKNAPHQEYLHAIRTGHLEQPGGSNNENHPGVNIHGESYKIDRLLEASGLCCAWLGLRALPAVARPTKRSIKVNSASVQDHSDAIPANPICAAMRSQGLNPPRLAAKVRALLKRRGKKPKVDRSTIYRLVSGQTEHPDPEILSAVLEDLQLPKG